MCVCINVHIRHRQQATQSQFLGKVTLSLNNSGFNFSDIGFPANVKNSIFPTIARERTNGFRPFPRVLELNEIYSASSWIRTRVAVSIPNNDNRYSKYALTVYIYIE